MTNLEKAKLLVSKMTLNEKVGQLAQRPFGFQAYTRDENNEIILTEEFKSYVLRFGGLGMLYGLFRADPWSKKGYKTGGIVASEREKAYNILQKFVIENTRLGIPVLMEDEAPHGRQVLDSVIYPVSLNVGCSFNPELYKKQTREIGYEAKIGGASVPYLSVFDMAIDPRWGRFEECFSEDPYLGSLFSGKAVEGVLESGNMVCCKHYLAQGSVVGGHNCGVSNIGEREIREIHLPVVESAVKAGCQFIMATYSEVDGEPCHANPYYLKTVLRDELGFKGVVRSDGGAVDRLVDFCGDDLVKSSAVAVRSGIDCGLWDESMTMLEEAVELGYITEKEIDEAVIRLIEKKYECGIMDKPYLDENGQSVAYLKSESGQSVAYEMACESLVLLKNSGVLPLKNPKILLIGGNLDNIYYILGDYTPEQKNATTIKDIFCANGATYLEGWNFLDGITVTDAELKQAVENADVVVFGCGGSSARNFESIYNDAGAIIEAVDTYMDCGEGCDLAELKLKPCQAELLKKIKSFNKPVVSLAIGGRAYILSDIEANSDALIWCGYPGIKGAQAIFDTLFGNKNNFGRLSFTFPRSVGQLPVYYNYKYSSNYVDMTNKPLYPFGYGLSYSKFEYSNVVVKNATAKDIIDGESIEVTFKIKNASPVKGKAVPQLYICKHGGTVTHRVKELKAVEKIELDAGESKDVKFILDFNKLREWSVNKKYEFFPCKLKLFLGDSSEDFAWQTVLDIK